MNKYKNIGGVRGVLIDKYLDTKLVYDQPEYQNLFTKPVGTLPIQITVKFTNSQGELITNAALPDGLKDKKLPYFLFNSFDKSGAYKQSLLQYPPEGDWRFLKSGIAGDNTLLYFTGFNNIQKQYDNGDLLLIFVDDLVNPSYFAYVILTSKRTSLASFIDYLPPYQVQEFYFGSDNTDDYLTPLTISKLDLLGNAKGDKVTPAAWLGPNQANTENVLIPMAFPLSVYNGISGYINAETGRLFYNFKMNQLTKIKLQ